MTAPGPKKPLGHLLKQSEEAHSKTGLQVALLCEAPAIRDWPDCKPIFIRLNLLSGMNEFIWRSPRA